MLTAFCLHAIPVGPELFLRDWGLSWQHPFPRKAQDRKCDLIGDMLTLYPYLPIVLISDSGQHNPEVYAEVVRQPPGRVRAVYIRNVSPKSARAAEIERRLKIWDTEVAPFRWTPMMLLHEVFPYAQDTPALRAGVPATDGRPGPCRPRSPGPRPRV